MCCKVSTYVWRKPGGRLPSQTMNAVSTHSQIWWGRHGKHTVRVSWPTPTRALCLTRGAIHDLHRACLFVAAAAAYVRVCVGVYIWGEVRTFEMVNVTDRSLMGVPVGARHTQGWHSQHQVRWRPHMLVARLPLCACGWGLTLAETRMRRSSHETGACRMRPCTQNRRRNTPI